MGLVVPLELALLVQVDHHIITTLQQGPNQVLTTHNLSFILRSFHNNSRNNQGGHNNKLSNHSKATSFLSDLAETIPAEVAEDKVTKFKINEDHTITDQVEINQEECQIKLFKLLLLVCPTFFPMSLRFHNLDPTYNPFQNK
jgi:hypothetical protein